MNKPIAQVTSQDHSLAPQQVEEVVAAACAPENFRGKRVLLIVPDGTRTAPVGLLFKTIYRAIGAVTRQFDVLIALGTHQPMSAEAICRRLEISRGEWKEAYRGVRCWNHTWDDPKSLRLLGAIPSAEINALSEGLFEKEVPVEINRRVLEYDQLIIVGPVFPHEVVGFSGGNKYLFPGVSGPQVLHFFHWLGAVMTNPKIIGRHQTPVRRVVDRAAAMVPVPKLCFCLVVEECGLTGLFAGTPEAAWQGASALSRERHIIYWDSPFHTILSCAPPMYEDLWTAGKCMYKLEPVLADGGELIIYAPHVREVSVTHGKTLEQIGYHCRDYFLKQWDRWQHIPWGLLAHSCHVYGVGTYENGVEQPRARVILATGIPPEICHRINLGYRDPRSVQVETFAHREAEGVLWVPKAGERLHLLKHPPAWAS